MPTIENSRSLNPAQFRELTDAELLAQDLVQQGAIHAISSLIQMGCTEANAVAMMHSLRKFADQIRKEGQRRGCVQFDRDQTVFN